MDELRFESNPTKGIRAVMTTNDGGVAPGKPPPPMILEKFRAMVKEKEDEVRALGGGVGGVGNDVSVVLGTDEIVRVYEALLSELTFNSKPIITDLTIIAGEQREHGAGIADVICARIVEVPVEQKLPSLYLLDSIVKNIGREYIRYFSARLPEVFCEAYRQIHPNMYSAMRHLFGTWSTVFPSSVLHKIENELQFSPPLNQQSSGSTPLRSSESSLPSHGIHVNPKYLEARRQLGHATADAIGAERLRSRGQAGHSSSGLDAGKLLPSVAKIARSTSSYGIGNARALSPSLEFGVDNSPRRLAERASPSHSGVEYGFSKLTGRNEETSLHKPFFPDGIKHIKQRYEKSSAFGQTNGIDLDRPRALIDAYGTDERERTLNHKYPKVQRHDANINGGERRIGVRAWQNTEEEEFDWEDMSPTLADRGRTDDLLSSSITYAGTLRTTPGIGTHHARPLASDPRSNWSKAQLSMINDPSVVDDNPSISSGLDAINNITAFREGATHSGSHHSQDAWSLSRNLHQSSQHVGAKIVGRSNQMPFAAGGALPLTGEETSFNGNYLNADEQLRGPSTMASRFNDSLTTDIPPAAVSAPAGLWPPPTLRNSHPRPSLGPQLQHGPMRSQLDERRASNAAMQQRVNKSIVVEQLSDSIESKPLYKLPQFSSLQHGPVPLNLQKSVQLLPVQPQLRPTQDFRQNIVTSSSVAGPSNLSAPPSNNGFLPQGHATSINVPLPNTIHGGQFSLLSNRNTPFPFPGGALPPLPRGPPPVSAQSIPVAQNSSQLAPNTQAGGAISGLINSLMSQGLISLSKQALVQDSVGLEFDQELLKVRHESGITALYSDLPRQCTTCGLRFKCQELHSGHMDWHVTKNRLSKNRKQKPSRKWFVNVSMWLSSAEALGTDAVPGFLPTENVEEKRDDEEVAVPADDDQNACALCGEPFDDFYSDEFEEWMYKGAVYMNAPSGSTAGMDRSQLGPIVHAKCRSESTGVSHEDSRKHEMDHTEEGSQIKRMRT